MAEIVLHACKTFVKGIARGPCANGLRVCSQADLMAQPVKPGAAKRSVRRTSGKDGERPATARLLDVELQTMRLSDTYLADQPSNTRVVPYSIPT